MSESSERALPARYWHIAISVTDSLADGAIENDLDLAHVKRRLLTPWHAGKAFLIGGQKYPSADAVKSVRVTCTTKPLASYEEASRLEEAKFRALNRGDGLFVVGTPWGNARYAALHDGEDFTSYLLFENAFTPAQQSEPAVGVTTKARALLFLDIVGWSKLTATQIRQFIELALPKLGGIVRERRPLMLNTWGDAIVAVFDSVVDCAETALKLCAFFLNAKGTDGVVDGMNARVGLHVGEVFWTTNPVTDHVDVFGPAVHTAARLEPVTAAGHAFCTATFASALAETSGEAPRAHSVGRISLAKGYGTQEVFVVLPRGAKAPAAGQFAPAQAASHDELADLGQRLAAKKVAGKSVLMWLDAAATDASVKSPTSLFAVLTKLGCTNIEDVFWHLVVAGVLEFKSIEFVVDDEYVDTAKQMHFGTRGKALLARLRADKAK